MYVYCTIIQIIILWFRYCRVQITEQINNRFVEVFFVDLGAFHEIECKSLLTIHPRLIIQLPFQVINNILIAKIDTHLNLI